MSTTDEIIYSIKQSVTARMVADALGIRVERGDRCRCLWHSDRHPSMRLYDGDRGCYCFACHAGGSVIDMVQQANHCCFRDALAWLNETFALDLPLNRKPSIAEIEASKRAREEARRQRDEQHERDMMLFETYVDVQKCIGELQDDAERYRPKPNDAAWDERYGRAMTLLPQMNDMAEALLTKMSERRNK